MKKKKISAYPAKVQVELNSFFFFSSDAFIYLITTFIVDYKVVGGDGNGKSYYVNGGDGSKVSLMFDHYL